VTKLLNFVACLTSALVSEQFLNGTSAQYKLCSVTRQFTLPCRKK